METHIRVVIAEDDHFAVNVLQRYLSGAPSIEVVGIAHDGRQALQIAQELQPDVLITDLYMPWLGFALHFYHFHQNLSHFYKR